MSQSDSHPQASPPPSNKRRRTDSERVQDPDIWMSDGNIIIATVDFSDDERPTYVLKCHKSLLARHSQVFEDLFHIAQPSVDDEYEGIPLVTLSDSYKDVKGLLRMLYDFRSVSAPPLCHIETTVCI